MVEKNERKVEEIKKKRQDTLDRINQRQKERALSLQKMKEESRLVKWQEYGLSTSRTSLNTEAVNIEQARKSHDAELKRQPLSLSRIGAEQQKYNHILKQNKQALKHLRWDSEEQFRVRMLADIKRKD
jgi:hypothetical protein